MPFYVPGVPTFTYGSRSLARQRYDFFRRVFGDEHELTRAAHGRWLALTRKAVPQIGASSVEAIAYFRQQQPGYMNRHHRRRVA